MAISKLADNMLTDNEGVAKVWVNFNGTGTVAINDSFNVSSITDIGLGRTQVNFSITMANTTYVATGSAGQDTAAQSYVVLANNQTDGDYNRTTTGCFIMSVNGSGVGTDKPYMECVFFGK